MKLGTLFAVVMAVAPVAIAAPATAQYLRLDYSGHVTNIFTGAPAGVSVGTPVYFEAVYNPANMVDRTATANATLTEFGLDPTMLPTKVGTVSLSDDPRASLTIRLGSDTFSKYTENQYGTPMGDTPIDLGIGNLPAVDFINGSFAGLSNSFVAPGGVGIDADPFAALLDSFDGHGFGIGLAMEGDPDPLDNVIAEGDVDLSTLKITEVGIPAVPEPASWALMIVGFGLVGSTFRTRRWGAAIERPTLV